MRILTVFEKELLDILKNKLLLYTSAGLPVIFLAISLGVVVFGTGGKPIDPRQIEMYYQLSPAFAGMNPQDVFQIIMIQQFNFMFLLTPALVPMTIAAFSVIGEKQARSLEPLLATPVRTWELLLGKSLAAIIPAVLATWISYGLLLVGLAFLASPVVFAASVSGMWLLAMIVLVPLLAILAVNIGILISSRVNDTRVAQQLGGLLAIPLIGIGMVQTAGFVLYSTPMFAIGAVALAALDVAVLVAATKLFQRETILTRWK